ncbi:MAG: lytic transglycosylase domain-containing protein [Desulfobacterales bacterium]|nr:lytic transglycosylase domain-containing protein [Desulfobacteraceae bacterium]MDY0312891.1 lytic transglycosylase domain-containing protein [Desulfobacterales bacterium]
MEDPAFIRPDRSRVLPWLWLMTIVMLIASAYLADRRLRSPETVASATQQTQQAKSPTAVKPLGVAPSPSEAHAGVRPIPVVRSDASYMRQVRQTHHLYRPIIDRVAKRYKVDPALVKAIIMAESGYDPKAVSHRGALGLMQIMPRTARALGVANSFDPERNITAGVRYFRQLMDTVAQDPALALAAYNAGPEKVRKYNGVPPYKATRRYIKKVMAYYLCYRDISRQESSLLDQG